MEASVLLASKALARRAAAPAGRSALTGPSRTATSHSAAQRGESSPPADTATSRARRASGARTARCHCPARPARRGHAKCPAHGVALPRPLGTANPGLPRLTPPRARRAPALRGTQCCSPKRRRDAGPRKAAVLPGTLEYSWASFWYFPCSSAAAISAPPPRPGRALPPAPHAREWQDALPGSGRRERDDVTAPCAASGAEL